MFSKSTPESIGPIGGGGLNQSPGNNPTGSGPGSGNFNSNNENQNSYSNLNSNASLNYGQLDPTSQNTNLRDQNQQNLQQQRAPVPMRLFAAVNTDKSSPNCIPRLCLLTINRLLLLHNHDHKSIMIAVRVQGTKRTIRSNEIQTAGGKRDIEIDLSFSIQYPHFLKKNCNYLQVMLQRRKRYKSRKILGFETLAIGLINMTEVLQRHQLMEKELDLLGEVKGDMSKSFDFLSKSSPLNQQQQQNLKDPQKQQQSSDFIKDQRESMSNNNSKSNNNFNNDATTNNKDSRGSDLRSEREQRERENLNLRETKHVDVVARIFMSQLKCQPIDQDQSILSSNMRLMKLHSSSSKSSSTAQNSNINSTAVSGVNSNVGVTGTNVSVAPVGDVDTDDFSSNDEGGSDSETLNDDAAKKQNDQQQSRRTTSSLHMTTRAKLSYLRSQMLGRQQSKQSNSSSTGAVAPGTSNLRHQQSTDQQSSPFNSQQSRNQARSARVSTSTASGSTNAAQCATNSASVQQKNFKQKLIALIKKFRTDSDDYDEQYHEALEHELMQAAGQTDPRAIEELLEEEDLDADDASAGDSSGPEWDDMSVSSTPKPSLRPFFSSTTLDKI